MVQPLFYGKVFAPYRLILLPFSLRILIAFLPQTTVPNLALPGTSPPSEGLGEAPSPLSFIPLYHHRKRQLPYFFIVQPFRDQAIYTEKYEVLQYSSPANHDSQPYPARHIPSFGGAWGGRPFPFLFPLWAWESSLFIFQIFPSTPPLARKY